MTPDPMTPSLVNSLARMAVSAGTVKVSEIEAWAYCPIADCRQRITGHKHPSGTNPAKDRDDAVERSVRWHLTHECKAARA